MDTLTVLLALSQIQDVQDFRLRDFMRELDMDGKQPALFYRELIKEAREAMPLLDQLHRRLAILEKAKAQMEAKLSSAEKEITALRAKMISLEGESHQLKDMASQLQEEAENYRSIKAVLKGRKDTDTLRALAHLFSDIYMASLYAKIAREPPAKLDSLTGIRAKLRDDLLEVLQVPRDKLEAELVKCRDQNEALKQAILTMAWARGTV